MKLRVPVLAAICSIRQQLVEVIRRDKIRLAAAFGAPEADDSFSPDDDQPVSSDRDSCLLHFHFWSSPSSRNRTPPERASGAD
jgi:hypothetical protein